MGRMVAMLLVIGVVVFVARSIGGLGKRIAEARRRGRIKPGAYEYDSTYNKASRKLKGVRGPAEDREGILHFVQSRAGVEAYVEPKTVAHPLSVVLVAADGEWKRFELAEDSFLRRLSREIGLPTYDAARVGYPQRMREYKRPSRHDDEKPA